MVYVRAACNNVKLPPWAQGQRLMRMLLIIFLTCTAIIGHPKDEFRRKYGEPISETFMVRPGISATVSYAPNGGITELIISPRTRNLMKSRMETLSQDSAKAIID